MPQGKRTGTGVRILLILLGILIGLLLTEMFLSLSKTVVFDHQQNKQNSDVRFFIYHHEDMGWFSKDPDLYWRFNEGRFRIGDIIGRPNVLRINSSHTRGPEIPAVKASHVFRIVCLGDSTTMGWEVDEPSTYEGQLQRLLNSGHDGRSFEVINAGVPAYTAYQGYVFLEKNLKLWKPDMVTIYFGSNDRYDAKTFYKEIKNSFLRRIDEEVRRRSRVYSLAKRVFLSFQLRNRLGKASLEQRQKGRNEYKDYLERIIDLARANMAEPVLLNYPSRSEVYRDQAWPYNQTVMAVAQKKHCVLVDLVSAFKKRKNDALFYDDIHPTPLGYQIIAQELEKTIFPGA